MPCLVSPGYGVFLFFMNYSSWFERIYPRLSGFGLWLRGGEINTVPPREFDSRRFRVLITRLSTYRDTADSFTHKLLYQIVSKIDGVYPDLAYLPPPKDGEMFYSDNVPWLLGTTSKHDGRDFSIIAFSLSIVQELLNISCMMKKSGLPPGKQERMADDSVPLVILGGASALYTSALFNKNPLVDGIFIGQDTGLIEKLFFLCRDCRTGGMSKKDTLSRMTAIPGFFEPDGELKTMVFHDLHLLPEQLLESGPVPYDEEMIGKGNLQLSEGCACFCSFCAESFSRKPYREFDAGTLLTAAIRMKASMGIDNLELYSFNFNMYRDFYKMLWELSSIFPSLGLKSQRLDSIAMDPELLNCLHAVGKSSITCGIEGISPRLRRYLHKSLSDSDLRKSFHCLLSAPLRELKIFLIATGLERDVDYDDFRALLQYMKTVMADSGRRPRVIFSVTMLVRFPWTPLEFEDAPESAICQQAVNTIEGLVRKASFEFRSSASALDYWLSQSIVRASGPHIGAAFLDAVEETGFVYYREATPNFIDSVKKHLEYKSIADGVQFKAISPQDRPGAPWVGLHSGIDESFLIRQWESARAFNDIGYCAGTLKSKGACLGCSACKGPAAIESINAQPASRTYTAEKLKDHVRATQSGAIGLHFKMTLGPFFRGIPRKMAGVALARALMLSESRATHAYRGFGSSFLQTMFSSDWLIGEDIVTLNWDGSFVNALRSLFEAHGFIANVNARLEGHGILHGQVTGTVLPNVKITMKSPFPFDLSGFSNSRSLRFMMRRTGTGCMQYEISRDSLKKKIITDCFSKQSPDGGVEVTCTPGVKFVPDEFAQTAFVLPQKNDWVRIEMRAQSM